MMRRIQEQLMHDFPELRNKRKVIPYFVSFDYPNQQRKMV